MTITSLGPYVGTPLPVPFRAVTSPVYEVVIGNEFGCALFQGREVLKFEMVVPLTTVKCWGSNVRAVNLFK
jgi:hypothetical protein